MWARPAYKKPTLHPGSYVAGDICCWLSVLGCSVAAVLCSPLIDAVGFEDDTRCKDIQPTIKSVVKGEGDFEDWRCQAPAVGLMRLQIAAYAVTFVIS